jgi:ketosteroid isomerase-like protein
MRSAERGGLVNTLADLDDAIEQSHAALAEFVKGNPEPLKLMFSRKEDVTLANPFGPPVRGWEQAAATMERAASLYRSGEVTGFDSVAKNVTRDLAYILEVEGYKAKIAGSDEVAPVTLRVTSIFRPEEGTWKIVHRHADPITAVQSPESVIQK